MPNMSYCRFENTYSDLVDCAEHVCNEVETDDTVGEDDYLSESEARYRDKLVDLCKEIADMSS